MRDIILASNYSIKESVESFVVNAKCYELEEREAKARDYYEELDKDNRLSVTTKRELKSQLRRIVRDCKRSK